MLSIEMRSLIEKAEHRAFATEGEDGPNVVPVSAAHCIEDAVVLCDFFMNKTAQNVRQGVSSALACWSGGKGIQIKGHATYEESGERFDRIVAWAKEKYPERTLSGVIVIIPDSAYDITPGNAGKQLL